MKPSKSLVDRLVLASPSAFYRRFWPVWLPILLALLIPQTREILRMHWSGTVREARHVTFDYAGYYSDDDANPSFDIRSHAVKNPQNPELQVWAKFYEDFGKSNYSLLESPSGMGDSETWQQLARQFPGELWIGATALRLKFDPNRVGQPFSAPLLEIARRGQKLEPQNAFWSLWEAALWHKKDKTKSKTALLRASKCKFYDDKTLETTSRLVTTLKRFRSLSWEESWVLVSKFMNRPGANDPPRSEIGQTGLFFQWTTVEHPPSTSAPNDSSGFSSKPPKIHSERLDFESSVALIRLAHLIGTAPYAQYAYSEHQTFLLKAWEWADFAKAEKYRAWHYSPSPNASGSSALPPGAIPAAPDSPALPPAAPPTLLGSPFPPAADDFARRVTAMGKPELAREALHIASLRPQSLSVRLGIGENSEDDDFSDASRWQERLLVLATVVAFWAFCWLLLNLFLWRAQGEESTTRERLVPALFVLGISALMLLIANPELLNFIWRRVWAPVDRYYFDSIQDPATALSVTGPPIFLGLFCAFWGMKKLRFGAAPSSSETQMQLSDWQQKAFRFLPALVALSALFALVFGWILLVLAEVFDWGAFDIGAWAGFSSYEINLKYQPLLLMYGLILSPFVALFWFFKWRYFSSPQTRPVTHSALRRWKESLGVCVVLGVWFLLFFALSTVPKRSELNARIDKFLQISARS